jgi:ketosteroid isomerase-like protein
VDSADTRGQITERRDGFVQAFNREDLIGLAEVCADTIAMMPPNQPVVVTVDAAVEWWRTGFTVGRSHIEILPRELYVADGWAFDWFDWTIRVIPLAGGTADVDHGAAFWLWRRQHDGEWRVTRAMWNSSTQTPSLWAGGLADFPIDELLNLMAPMVP